MAISPISDIVLDVARAADPAKYRAAAAGLGNLAGAPADPMGTFEDALGATRRPASLRTPFDPALALVQMRSNDALRPDSARPYEAFEAFVLQTFIESMLPKESEALFGAGTAGEIWKAMLAEGLGHQLASAGGIGIARMLAEQEPQVDRAEPDTGSASPTRS